MTQRRRVLRVFLRWCVPLLLILGWGMYQLANDNPRGLGWVLVGPHQFLSMPGLMFEEIRSNVFAHGARLPGFFAMVVVVAAAFWSLLGTGATLLVMRRLRNRPLA